MAWVHFEATKEVKFNISLNYKAVSVAQNIAFDFNILDSQ